MKKKKGLTVCICLFTAIAALTMGLRADTASAGSRTERNPVPLASGADMETTRFTEDDAELPRSSGKTTQLSVSLAASAASALKTSSENLIKDIRGSGKNSSPSEQAGEDTVSSEASGQAGKLTENTEKIRLKIPEADGLVTYSNDFAAIDASHTDQGYVCVKYQAGETRRIKVQITRAGGTTYTYNLAADGQYDVFPLSQGDGTYQINVFRNLSGDRYTQVYGKSVSVKLQDQLLPFLYPNQYVNFDEKSAMVARTDLLCSDDKTDLEKVETVYNYVIKNIKYDYELAASAESTYLPNLDLILQKKKGICFDYAALMSGMLRSQNIPAKLVIGYTSRGEYHAWISVYINEIGWVNDIIQFDGKKWKLMDPTFASTGGSSRKTLEYINNESNYSEKYCY